MSAIYGRAELIARVGQLKIMVTADYGELPEHYKMWKTWRNKEDIQFLHVLPCRCGKLLSSTDICNCSDHVLDSYKLRNKRWFFEEKYNMYVNSKFDEKFYLGYVNTLQYQEAIQKEGYESFNPVFSKGALEIKETAIRRFGLGNVNSCLKTAKAIAFLENHKEIEKSDILEALSYGPRW